MTVLWDFNGTILDDVQLVFDIENDMLRRRNMPLLTMEHYLSIFGFPVRDYYERAGHDLSQESYEDIAAEYIAAYQSAASACKAREGVREAIRTLHERGVRQGVLSASRRDHLLTQLDALGLTASFDVILGIDDIYAASKAEVARQWMEREGISPAELLLLGDTEHDHEVAREIGAACALVLGGHQDEKRLRATGRPVFQDIPAWLAWMEEGQCAIS